MAAMCCRITSLTSDISSPVVVGVATLSENRTAARLFDQEDLRLAHQARGESAGGELRVHDIATARVSALLTLSAEARLWPAGALHEPDGLLRRARLAHDVEVWNVA